MRRKSLSNTTFLCLFHFSTQKTKILDSWQPLYQSWFNEPLYILIRRLNYNYDTVLGITNRNHHRKRVCSHSAYFIMRNSTFCDLTFDYVSVLQTVMDQGQCFIPCCHKLCPFSHLRFLNLISLIWPLSCTFVSEREINIFAFLSF